MKILLLSLFITFSAFAGDKNNIGHDGNVCNGGGGESEAFVKLGSEISQIISSGKIQLSIPNFDATKFEFTVKNAIVIASDEPQMLNGEEKDALNYPAKQKIIFNIKKFNKRTNHEKSKLVIHEYLWLMGIYDENYIFSEIIETKIEEFLDFELFKSALKDDISTFAQKSLYALKPNFQKALEILVPFKNSENLKKCTAQDKSHEDYINNHMPFCEAFAIEMKNAYIDSIIITPENIQYRNFLQNKNVLLVQYLNQASNNKKRADLANKYIGKASQIVNKYVQKILNDGTALNNSYNIKCPGRITTSINCALNITILYVAQEEPIVLENFTSKLIMEIDDLINEIDSLH